jgi:hypothetical protein
MCIDTGRNIILCECLGYGRLVCDTEVNIEVSEKLQCCLCVFRVDLDSDDPENGGTVLQFSET